MIAARLCSVEQGKGPQSPAPCPAPHPRSQDWRAQNVFAELDTHNSVPAEFRGRAELKLRGEPYQAIRFRRVS